MAQPSNSPETSNPAATAPATTDAAVAGGPGPGRRVRRRLLLILLAVLVIGGIGVVEVPQLLSPAPTQTIWQAITAGINGGVVPKQTALEAFAYVYKVDIPDVTVPRGTDGGDAPTSGTGVTSWVQANWNALTPDQQAVISRYLPPATQAGTRQMTPAPTAATAASARPRFQLDGVVNPWPILTNLAPDAPTDLAMAMSEEVATDIAHIGNRLGLPIISIGLPGFPNIMLTISDKDGGDALFETNILDYPNLPGHIGPCAITAFANAWKGESVNGNGGGSPRLHVLITHEVVHCYQNTIWGSSAIAELIPSWIKEGSAMYLAADDTQVAEPTLGAVWTNGYIGRDETALVDRTYDAFGYFALLAHEGRDLWDLMAKAWQAAATGPERSNAFIGVLTGDAPDIVDNWAESYLRAGLWQDPWIMYGFGLPDSAEVTQHPAQAQPDPGWIGSVNSRANTVLNVTSSSGEVVTVTTDGLASVHDGGSDSYTAFQTQTFCTADSCVCPQGTLLAGRDMASQHLAIPFVAAFNGAVGGSKYAIISDTLDNLCKRRATPQPQGSPSYGPCGASCTQSNGDPHLATLNKYRYDFQAAGEFTLLKSPDGSVDIQARQEPFGTGGYVSINTAIAAKVGGHRVGVYMTSSGLVAHVDGSVVDVSSGSRDLGGGGSISAIDKGYQIDFPDGTQLWTLSVGQYGINAQIKPSAALRGNGVGPLGAIIPGGLEVPAMPDGTLLPAATSSTERAKTIDGVFADAWRLTDSTTLFDYDSGKSTASYTIKPFPTNPTVSTAADLSASQQAAGDAACSAITDQGLHDDCVFDVGATGQTGFASSYTATQDFYDSGVATGPTAGASTAPASPPPGLVSGAVTLTNATTLGGYAIGDNGLVYVSVQTGDTTYGLIAFDTKAGKIVQQVTEPAGRRHDSYRAGDDPNSLQRVRQRRTCRQRRRRRLVPRHFQGGHLDEPGRSDDPHRSDDEPAWNERTDNELRRVLPGFTGRVLLLRHRQELLQARDRLDGLRFDGLVQSLFLGQARRHGPVGPGRRPQDRLVLQPARGHSCGHGPGRRGPGRGRYDRGLRRRVCQQRPGRGAGPAVALSPGRLDSNRGRRRAHHRRQLDGLHRGPAGDRDRGRRAQAVDHARRDTATDGDPAAMDADALTGASGPASEIRASFGRSRG